MIRETNYDHLFESQTQYRTLLDAMAKPGTIIKLESDIQPPTGIHTASALVGFILMNSDVTFHVAHIEMSELNTYFIVNTSSSPAEADTADFIYISGAQENKETIARAKWGEPEYPELGAFVIIDVDHIAAEAFPKGKKITLSGPGVLDHKTIYIDNLNDVLLSAIQEKNIEFPLGIDVIIADRAGHVVCIPRSNKINHQEI